MIVLGEVVDIKRNLLGSFKLHWWLWVLLFLAIIFDGFSTVYFMFVDGVDTEANAIVRWLVYEFGMVVGVVLGKVLQFMAALVFVSLSKNLAREVLLLLVLLNVLAVINNVF